MTAPEKSVEEIVDEFRQTFRATNDDDSRELSLLYRKEITDWLTQTLEAERQKREEAVEAAVEKGRWQGVMASMNTLAAHTDQIWQSTIQKDSIYKYIDDVQAEAEQKLQALTQPNNQ